MNPTDEIWNRAAMNDGGADPHDGDRALSAVLTLHNMAMSGGLLDGIERLTPTQFAMAEAGYRWLGLEAAADVVVGVRDALADGAMDDDAVDELEARADVEYGQAVPQDQTIVDAFHLRYAAEPTAFAPLDAP